MLLAILLWAILFILKEKIYTWDVLACSKIASFIAHLKTSANWAFPYNLNYLEHLKRKKEFL
jgi:hypothetical protein